MKKYLLLLLLCPSFLLAKPTTLKVLLDWYPNPNHAPIVLAESLGYFKNEQLHVKLITPADPSIAPKLIATNQADIGISYQPKLIVEQNKNLPIVQVGTLIATPLDCLIMLGENQNIKALKGKKIGFSDAGTGQLMLKTMLKSAGLSMQDVTLVNVHYSLTQALLTHKVDAITGVMRNVELPAIRQKNPAITVFYPEEYQVPYYSELIYISYRKTTKKQSIKAFLAAVEKATAFILNHPESAWQSYIKAYPDQNTPENRKVWNTTYARFALRPSLIDMDRQKNLSAFITHSSHKA